MRRNIALLCLALFAVPTFAADGKPELAPIPAPPPPPAGYEADAALEPQVTIRRQGEDKVEEYRVNGKLYMIKVTPLHGQSYYLVDREGQGNFSRHDLTGAPVRPPMWVIGTF